MAVRDGDIAARYCAAAAAAAPPCAAVWTSNDIYYARLKLNSPSVVRGRRPQGVW